MIAGFKPQEAAIEETFVNKDARATLKLGQARGMALLAPAQRGLRIAEYPPNVVKKTVTGTGHGEKRQIQAMVGFLLPKAKFESADEADALAIAICHASHRSQRAGHCRPQSEGGACRRDACHDRQAQGHRRCGRRGACHRRRRRRGLRGAGLGAHAAHAAGRARR